MRLWRHRPFCIALLLYQALWLNAVVPGHTRGAVLLPGTDSCPQCVGPRDGRARPATPTKPCCSHRQVPGVPDGRASHCAVCHFAAVLTVPPATELAPAPVCLLRRLSLLPPATAPEARPLADYYTRGPPATPTPPC
jgi:hypothetical protein